MELDEIQILKEDERGIILTCGTVNFIKRKKGSISANHRHGPETIYLVEGEVELTIGEETKTVKAPIKIKVADQQYHKLIALTDITLLVDR